MFINLILLLIIAVMGYMYWRLHGEFNESKTQAEYWFKTAGGLQVEYAKLDQGMTEITDAYESDSLQYEETIEKLNDGKVELKTILGAAQEKIVDQTNTIDDLNVQIATLRGENIHLRRTIDISQRIISEHDLNCLPHIVLSHMEQEKDTPLPI